MWHPSRVFWRKYALASNERLLGQACWGFWAWWTEVEAGVRPLARGHYPARSSLSETVVLCLSWSGVKPGYQATKETWRLVWGVPFVGRGNGGSLMRLHWGRLKIGIWLSWSRLTFFPSAWGSRPSECHASTVPLWPLHRERRRAMAWLL